MGSCSSNPKDVELLARLMRAEAESDGNMGMLLVGNVCVNRVLANCHDFKNINTIQQMVFQSPGDLKPYNLITSINAQEIMKLASAKGH